MSIVTNLRINKKLSMDIAEEFCQVVKLNQCYRNVFDLVHDFCIEDDYKVAFGYYGLPTVNMIRHCFLISPKNEIIDPTNIIRNEPIYTYHIFKIFEFYEYMDLFEELFEKDDNEEVYDSLLGLIPEEQDYCNYAIENNVLIDQYSYNFYLKKYDTQGLINVYTYDERIIKHLIDDGIV